MADGFTVNDFDHLEKASDASYGVYDTQENCWLGDETGPRLFTRELSKEANGVPQELLARIAAQLAGVQCGYAVGRLQARVFNEDDLVLKDSVPTKMSAVEALTKLENGE
jgi:hypothetical protein